MKKIITLVTLLFIVGVVNSQDQEKRIKFNNGTLKICSNSHMVIKGYDGDEVIIKSLNNQSRFSYRYFFNEKDEDKEKEKDSLLERSFYLLSAQYEDAELEKGLRPLGNKSNNPADNLYLDITEKPGELIIKDFKFRTSGKNKVLGYTVKSADVNEKKSKKNSYIEAANLAFLNNKYEILIPNSIKLSWNVEDCAKTKSNTFFVRSDSTPWELMNFKGEAEISTSYNSIKLTDVSGPVIANTIGGNIKVVFDDLKPTNLYSLVSNDGYIDVTLPLDANINLDATADRILSNIDFKVLKETVTEVSKNMKLELNSGKIKMKLDAGSGNLYLRKKD